MTALLRVGKSSMTDGSVKSSLTCMAVRLRHNCQSSRFLRESATGKSPAPSDFSCKQPSVTHARKKSPLPTVTSVYGKQSLQ